MTLLLCNCCIATVTYNVYSCLEQLIISFFLK